MSISIYPASIVIAREEPVCWPIPLCRCSSADLSWNYTGGFGLETAWFASSCKDGGWHGSLLAFNTWRLSWYSHRLTWIHTQIFLKVMVWRRHSYAIWGVGPIKVSSCDVLDSNSQTKKKEEWKIEDRKCGDIAMNKRSTHHKYKKSGCKHRQH